MKNFDHIIDEGEELVKTARNIVTEFLQNNKKVKLDKSFESKFSINSGVFVTLNNPLGLRGCIGFPLPEKKLYTALEEAAIAAATEDPRFPAVTENELNEITFEVTILSPPKEIQVSDTNQIPTKIKVGKDGLIIKRGFFSGLLLPQVPFDYGWNETEFLDHTCEKAGLPSDSWKKTDTQVMKFEGIIFKEEKPMGNILRVRL